MYEIVKLHTPAASLTSSVSPGVARTGRMCCVSIICSRSLEETGIPLQSGLFVTVVFCGGSFPSEYNCHLLSLTDFVQTQHCVLRRGLNLHA